MAVVVKPGHQRKQRLRNLLRHSSVVTILLSFLPIAETVSHMHKLNKLTQSKNFRFGMEQAFRGLLTRQVSRDDRIWLIIYKTKLYKLMKLNYANFYS